MIELEKYRMKTLEETLAEKGSAEDVPAVWSRTGLLQTDYITAKAVEELISRLLESSPEDVPEALQSWAADKAAHYGELIAQRAAWRQIINEQEENDG